MKGSEWKKWDLHFHTPSSYDYKDKSVTNEEIINILCEKNVSVIAITDHNTIDVNRIKILQELGKNRITVLPGIEILSDSHGKEPIHFIGIFSEMCDIDYLWKQLESKTELHRIQGEGKKHNEVYCSLLNTIKLIKELNGIVTIHAGSKSNGIENITNSLPHNIAQKEDMARVIDIFELGKEEDISDYETIVIPHLVKSIKKHIPLIICSDNHNIRSYSTKQNLWIKAEPTFEGLKQVIYEPLHRVAIKNVPPRTPVRKIDSIKFNFPQDVYIKKVGNEIRQDLCIRNITHEIHFNPYFTCLIGGRGTGKSTIINILAEKLESKTDFFDKKNNSIYINSKAFDFRNDIENTIEILGTEEIEFVSQGRVEELAEGDKLTKLIFEERIREIEPQFEEIKANFEIIVSYLDRMISLIFELSDIHHLNKEKQRNKNNSQKIVDSENDPRYKDISIKIIEISFELSLLKSSEANYLNILTSLKEVINNTIGKIDLNDPISEYDLRVSEIIQYLKNIDEIKDSNGDIFIEPQKIAKVSNKIDDLNTSLAIEKQKLQAFFTEKGTSEESIKDAQNAAENVSRLTRDIKGYEEKISTIKQKLKEYEENTVSLESLYEKKNELIINSIQAINERLKTHNGNVSEIRFEHDFNKELYEKSLFEEFYKTFSKYHIPNTQVDKISEVLFLIPPDLQFLNLGYEDFISAFENSIIENKYNKNTNYISVVNNIFLEKNNFIIYKILVRKHLYNLLEYVKINGFYGNRELNSCSFGQRCTAVIVTLLMTGVKPLIIDEPEAHLDNKLIAEYLVDLIKTKKLDRQIIFATHNSNFAINGDAELIHILETPDNENYTVITSTTIENTGNRDKLLKLEGGETAFLTRESKYGIVKK